MDRFVEDIRAIVDEFEAELQRSAACERKACRIFAAPLE